MVDYGIIREVSQFIVSQLREKKYGVALTGAGISVESGIPDFRSPEGLWSKFDIEEYGTIDAFYKDPRKVWRLFKEIGKTIYNAKPNRAHEILAIWEDRKILKGIITQNIDRLHQKAGSQFVYELHGSGENLVCIRCSYSEPFIERYIFEEETIPECKRCGQILKPDVVLFGEPLPQATLFSSIELTRKSSFVLVIGTSAVVMPAAYIPIIGKECGAKIIEINISFTALTKDADWSLQGNASFILELLNKNIEQLI